METQRLSGQLTKVYKTFRAFDNADYSFMFQLREKRRIMDKYT